MDARTKAASSRSSTRDRKTAPERPPRKTKAARPAAAQTPARSAKSQAASARRTWIVVAGLVLGLAFTGALLKVMAPPPLTPDATASLFAVKEQSIDRVFDTPVAIKQGRWHSIYVHQSLTPTGDALSLGSGAGGLPDHFLIGNGEPLADGAIQTSLRWNQQLTSGGVPGFDVDEGCLTICLVGDFNQSQPTLTQQARLVELIHALQKQLGIPSDQIWLGKDVAETTAAGVGRHFPILAIRSQLGI